MKPAKDGIKFLIVSALCMMPQARDKWWLISKIKQPWRNRIRQIKLFCVWINELYTCSTCQCVVTTSRQFQSAPVKILDFRSEIY